jgi:flavin reductase (DIM6/NTAB) family NADH-FMN oxidoreductase RutF
MAQVGGSVHDRGGSVDVPVGPRLWSSVFSVAPLVLVGTKERDGYDFAPKHMAMPLGWEGFYAFVCSPRHATYTNVKAHPEFTVSFPRPAQILETSFAAGGRLEDGEKPTLAAVPAARARRVDVPVVEGCAFCIECELERIVDGFGANSLIIGRVVAAAAAPDVLRSAEGDDADLVYQTGLLAYLASGRIAVVRDSTAFPYAVDFRL